MNKIITSTQPFSPKQYVYVLADDQVIETHECDLINLPTVISNLTYQYNINQVELKGNYNFNEKIEKDIKQEAISKYNNSNINIERIK